MTEFGPIKFLIEAFMLPFLTFSYNTFVPNYGISIILLTIVIKIINSISFVLHYYYLYLFVFSL